MAKTDWLMDAAHAEVRFRIRHLMVSWVSGSFQDFNASLETEDLDMTTAKVRFSAKANSISTNNEKRDEHLRSADFFDVDHFPELMFQCDGLQQLDGEQYSADGLLTIRGITHPLTLQIEFGGIVEDPRGNTRTGFTITGKVNRTHYGLTFTRLSETGEKLLGETVTLMASAEFLLNKHD